MPDRSPSTFWPAPEDGQVRLTLLGSVHLANPEHDEHNPAVDDVLAPARQSELRDLRERLESDDFDAVAVEAPWSEQAALDSQYDAFRDRGALDDEAAFPDGPCAVRGEAVQVGFRLASSLGLERVHAVDSDPEFPDVDADWAIDEDQREVPYPLPDFEAVVDTQQRLLETESLPAVLRAVNQVEHLRTLHSGNVAASFSSSDASREYAGSQQVAYWYERNARMVENLSRVTAPGERALFVVGASHVLPVKQLADAAPATCPESPLPLLAD